MGGHNSDEKRAKRLGLSEVMAPEHPHRQPHHAANNLPEVLLHIGTYKTGTTFLQAVFAGNFDRLLKHGILYPVTCRSTKAPTSHGRLLPRYRGDRFIPSDGWKELHEEIERHQPHKVLLSAEGFCRPHPTSERLMLERVRWIRSKLPCPVTIIVYLREKHSYLASHYAHKVKKGVETRSFSDYCESEAYLADYERMLKPWKEVFDHVIVRPYSSNVLDDFRKVAGLPKLVVRDKRVNVAPSNKTIRVMLVLNRVLRRFVRPWTIKHWYEIIRIDRVSRWLPISNRAFAERRSPQIAPS